MGGARAADSCLPPTPIPPLRSAQGRDDMLKVARTIEETRVAIRGPRAAGRTVGLVPTMGFLHEGHLSLIRVAREHGADFVAVSIFVNPLQFAPHEDFQRYPRDEEHDRKLLEREGVDLLFLPSIDVMYPPNATTRVTVTGVAEALEGERRPGHFTGVATVVSKLFNIVQPELAVFGRKDAQQCAVIERMVRDLDIPIRLVFGETIREHDGLAMSSRNSYLSGDEQPNNDTLPQAPSCPGRIGQQFDVRYEIEIEAAAGSIQTNSPASGGFFPIGKPIPVKRDQPRMDTN